MPPDDDLVPVRALLDLNAFLMKRVPSADAGADYDPKACIESGMSLAKKLLAIYATAVKALTKGGKDYASAVQTTLTSARLRHQNQQGAAADPPKAKTRLSSMASTSDPAVIKIHRNLEKRAPVSIVKTFEDLDPASARGSRPFIIRKGKCLDSL